MDTNRSIRNLWLVKQIRWWVALFATLCGFVNDTAIASKRAYPPTTGICGAAASGDLVKVAGFVAADPKALDERKDGSTALHYAAIYGRTTVVDFLLKNGANASTTSDAGYTPLHHAVMGSSMEIVRLLLANGADPNAHSNKTDTVLSFACSYGIHGQKPELVRLLLEAGSDPNLKSRVETTPLQVAAFHGPIEVLDLLLSKGADVNAVGFQGSTALHWAVDGRNEAAAKLLIEHGAKLDARDGEGRTVLQRAHAKAAETGILNRKKIRRIIKLLVESGPEE
jgi:ankyrin repeat protein